MGLGSEAKDGETTGVDTTGETVAGIVLDGVESSFVVSSFFGDCATGAGSKAVVGAKVDFAAGAGITEDLTGDGCPDNGSIWAATEGIGITAEDTDVFADTGVVAPATKGLLPVATGDGVINVGTGKG